VRLEGGPLSLISAIEEILEEKVEGSVYEIENTAVGILRTDYAASTNSKSWHLLYRQAAVVRSV
jgi:hypothetical protein